MARTFSGGIHLTNLVDFPTDWVKVNDEYAQVKVEPMQLDVDVFAKDNGKHYLSIEVEGFTIYAYPEQAEQIAKAILSQCQVIREKELEIDRSLAPLEEENVVLTQSE